MCGITLYYSNRVKFDPKRYYQAHLTLAHRGPDDEGFLYKNEKNELEFLRGEDSDKAVEPYKQISLVGASSFFLGHRRLSIIDLSVGGHQPFQFQHLTLSYNGEIYNYVELRAELKKSGYAFETQSDTEVFLKAYHHWGSEAFNKFIGMWAAILYDAKEETILLTRDPFGIKPLYYTFKNGTLMAGSEIKYLLSMDSHLKQEDRKAVYDFITYMAKDHAEHTFYKDIKQLNPGSSLLFQPRKTDNPIQTIPYFDFEAKGGEKYISPEEIRHDVENSINLHLRSDVKLGISLSGGTDSSIIASTLASQGRPLVSYSAIFEGQENYDESRYIRGTIQKYKEKFESHYISPDSETTLKDFDKILYYMDEPVRTMNLILPLHIYKKAAGHGVKVMLGGQGGDEMFGGYRDQFREYWLELLKKGRMVALLGSIANNDLGLTFRDFLSFAARRVQIINQVKIKKNEKYRSRLGVKGPSYYEEFMMDTSSKTRLKYFTSGLRDYLNHDDRMSMASSIEARVPFLNSKIFRRCIHNSYGELMKGGITKNLLREAFKDILYKGVYERRDKMGYPIPQKEYVKEHLSTLKDEIRRCPLFKNDVSSYLDCQKGSHYYIWRLYVVSRWYNGVRS